MYYTNFLEKSDNRWIYPEGSGKYHIVEYDHDVSTSPELAIVEYFAGKMNVRKRQLAIQLKEDDVVIQSGAMQWFTGDVTVKTDIKSVGNLAKKLAGSAVTKETAVKPRYTGTGLVVLEPSCKYIFLEDLDKWGSGMVIEDHMFLACDGDVDMKVVARKNISSAVLGGEGLFNTCLSGKGIVALESNVPKEELVFVDLNNDVLKVDGSFVVAWSKSLSFSVERTTKTLIGSAASGEGLVNVYRGTGHVLLAPVSFNNRSIPSVGK